MKKIDRNGDSWEYLVLYKASRKECEVSRNAYKVGPYDLILHINGKSYKCDVKVDTKRYKDNYYPNPRLSKLPDDVYMICVNPVTERVYWHSKKVPVGLEAFWE